MKQTALTARERYAALKALATVGTTSFLDSNLRVISRDGLRIALRLDTGEIVVDRRSMLPATVCPTGIELAYHAMSEHRVAIDLLSDEDIRALLEERCPVLTLDISRGPRTLDARLWQKRADGSARVVARESVHPDVYDEDYLREWADLTAQSMGGVVAEGREEAEV